MRSERNKLEVLASAKRRKKVESYSGKRHPGGSPTAHNPFERSSAPNQLWSPGRPVERLQRSHREQKQKECQIANTKIASKERKRKKKKNKKKKEE